MVGLCGRCSVQTIAFNRYFEANIPLEYWGLEVPESVDGEYPDFKGTKEIIKIYVKMISNLTQSYINGSSLCLAGTHGVGKTSVITNVLKKACHKNYSCLYTTLSDMVSSLTLPPNEDRFLARKELMEVDFLAVDEFDNRYVATEAAADLFGRTLEHIIRTRLQNRLPTILCSNSPNPLETFQGSIRQSLESLMTKIPLVVVVGPDVRKMGAQ